MPHLIRRQIVVEETAGIDRSHCPICIKLGELTHDPATINWKSLTLTDSDGQPVQFQFDRLSRQNGYALDDEIVFQIAMRASETRRLALTYGTQAVTMAAVGASDLTVTRQGGRVVVENARFIWELTDSENAEVRIKTADGPSESFEARTFTRAGDGSQLAPWDDHAKGRRHLVRVAGCDVVAAGPIRAMIDVYYDDVHFADNNDIVRRLVFYSGCPMMEKFTTSTLGEDRILAATMVAKMGPLSLAQCAWCGSDGSVVVNYPCPVPAEAPAVRSHDLGFHNTFWPAAGRHLGQIDGYTWGAVWNPDSGLGKAEVARIDQVAGFIAAWEPGRYHATGDSYAAAHPKTDRVYGDFEFVCANRRSFRHCTAFLDAAADGPDLHPFMDAMTRCAANSVTVTVGIEELCDPNGGPMVIAPAGITCDVTGGATEFDVALPANRAPESLKLTVDGPVADLLALPDLTSSLEPGDRCFIAVTDPYEMPAGVHTGTVTLTINDEHSLAVPVTLVKSDHPPHGEMRYGPLLPTGTDPIRIEVLVSADTWLDRITMDWWRDGERFSAEEVFGPQTQSGQASFFIPPQRAGTALRFAVTASDVHGRTGGLQRTLNVLDATLDVPPTIYTGEATEAHLRITARPHGLMTPVRLTLDDEDIAGKFLTLGVGESEDFATAIRFDDPGEHIVEAHIEMDGTQAVLTQHIEVIARPDLPHEDFVALLARPDKCTLHGNLRRYWGGQMCPEYALTEPETVGFTHPWFYDGTSYGSGSSRNWEFWRDEHVACGILRCRETGEMAIYPPVDHVDWQPGQMDCHTDCHGLTIHETKFISNDDVFGDIIRITNTQDVAAKFSLLFKGHGHGMSEGRHDAQRQAAVIDQHAYAYTGLKTILAADRPFDCWASSDEEGVIDARIRAGDVGRSAEPCYGKPVWYVFGFDIDLAAGETTEIVLTLGIERDLSEGFAKLCDLMTAPRRELEAVRFKWNDWLNHQPPRLECSDEAWRELYYYLYFCYRCNLLDIGEGFSQDPYVTPAASINFHAQFGWDSAFHVWIGRWLADPETYTYGHLTNWVNVQPPCGFLPEFFGQSWFTTWDGGSIWLLACALHDLYRQTGDGDLLARTLPMVTGFEAWRSCEVEFSPYWQRYYNNIPDWRERQEMAQRGDPWTDNATDYYRRLAYLADATGDADAKGHFEKKLALCEQRVRESLPADDTPCGFGRFLYDNADLVPAERVEQFLNVLTDPRQMWMSLPMPQQSLAKPRPGDIWDLGTSVTVNYFITEGLFRAGREAVALEMLTRQIEASFMDIDGRRVPIAPEYWNEQAEPWGSIEYAWNGLINDFLLSRVVGIQPDVPAGVLRIQPNVPDHLDDVAATIPLAGRWTKVAHTVDRSDGLVITTDVTDAALKTVELRYRIPDGLAMASITLDGQDAEATEADGFVVLTVAKRTSFDVVCRFGKR